MVIHVWLYMCGYTCVVIPVWLYMCGYTCVVIHVWLYMCGYTCVVMHVWLYMCGYTCVVIHVWLWPYCVLTVPLQPECVLVHSNEPDTVYVEWKLPKYCAGPTNYTVFVVDVHDPTNTFTSHKKGEFICSVIPATSSYVYHIVASRCQCEGLGALQLLCTSCRRCTNCMHSMFVQLSVG